MRPRVLVTSYYNRDAVQPALRRLGKVAEITLSDVARSLRPEELRARLQGMDAVIAAEERYTKEILDGAAGLKVIARDGVGLDSIDLAEATNHGVVVVNAPVVHESVADLAMGLILAVVRKIIIGDKGMRTGRWQDRDRYLSRDVTGSCLGLLGFGAIGQAVARRARSFGMRILAYSRNPDRGVAAALGVNLVGFDTLLAESDVLSIHVPLTAETRGLIDERAFARMKLGAYLVNTSRGEVLREEALCEALREGRLAGAAMDVLAQEPPRESNPLLALDGVVLTPHVGSDTVDTFLKVYECVVADLLAFFEGRRPAHVVNPAVLDGLGLR